MIYLNEKRINKRTDIIFMDNIKIYKFDGDFLAFNKLFSCSFTLDECKYALSKIIHYRNYKIGTFLTKCDKEKFYDDSSMVKYLNYTKDRKSISPNIEYYSIIYYGDNLFKKIEEYNLRKKNKLTPYNVEYWLNKGYDEVESKEKILKYKKNKATTLENYIKKYGNIEGTKKYNDYCQKSAHSLNSFVLKYGIIEGEERYKEYLKSKDSSSLNWAMKKTNNDYKKAVSLFTEKNKKTTNKFKSLYDKEERSVKFDSSSLSFFLKKEGNINKAMEQYLSNSLKKDSSSLDYFLKKYPNNIEKAKFEFKLKKLKCAGLYGYYLRNNKNFEDAKNEYLLNSKKRQLSYNKYSKSSNLLFLNIIEMINDSNNEYHYGENEFSLEREDKIGLYFYDFCIKNKNIIIEFNGKLFHPNYEKYDSELLSTQYFLSCVNDNDIQDKIKNDKAKIELAIKKGYSVLILWEEDGPQINYSKIIEFLQSKNIIINEN